MNPAWTAVVVNYNGASYLEACLSTLTAVGRGPVEIIVVDNASSDDSLQELHGFPRVRVLAQPRNLGFAGGANVGLAAVESPFALLLNPDIEVDTLIGGALLEAFASDPRLGAAGALLLYPDGRTIQHAGGVIERPLMTTRHLGYQETDTVARVPADVDFVTGGAMALRVDAARAVGGFDERFSPVYYEDVDLCARMRDAGWKVRFIPSMQAVHHEGVTLGRSATYYRHIHRNRVRFALKHLTNAEWRLEFVPAELTRLRSELASFSDEKWPERSGADAIEALLRGIDDHRGWDAPSLISGGLSSSLASPIETARSVSAVVGRPMKSHLPLVARFRNLLNDLGPRWYVDDALAQQRLFNVAVIAALEALNRDQMATALLLALDMLDRLRVIEAGRTGLTAE